MPSPMDCQMPVVGIEPLKERSRTVHEIWTEAEDFDLLGALVTRTQVAQVIELTPLRGLAEQHGVVQHGEAGFAEKHWHSSREKEEQKPRREEDKRRE